MTFYNYSYLPRVCYMCSLNKKPKTKRRAQR